MTVYEALSLLFQAGLFLLALLMYIEVKYNANNQPYRQRYADYFLLDNLASLPPLQRLVPRGTLAAFPVFYCVSIICVVYGIVNPSHGE